MESPLRILINDAYDDQSVLRIVEEKLDDAGIYYEIDAGGRFIIDSADMSKFDNIIDYDYDVVA